MSLDSITQLIYSCVDLILHLFIVCIYWAAYHLLCACIVWPTVLLRWLGRCCWHFLWFLLLLWGGQNKKDVTSYDWSLGLLCLFYQIGCVFHKKKKHSVLSVHSCCVLIVCMCFTKPVHSQTRKPTCSHPSKIAHSLKTNIINCDSLKKIQLLYPNIYSSPEWPASLTNTHTNSSGYYLSCSN